MEVLGFYGYKNESFIVLRGKDLNSRLADMNVGILNSSLMVHNFSVSRKIIGDKYEKLGVEER